MAKGKTGFCLGGVHIDENLLRSVLGGEAGSNLGDREDLNIDSFIRLCKEWAYNKRGMTIKAYLGHEGWLCEVPGRAMYFKSGTEAGAVLEACKYITEETKEVLLHFDEAHFVGKLDDSVSLDLPSIQRALCEEDRRVFASISLAPLVAREDKAPAGMSTSFHHLLINERQKKGKKNESRIIKM